MVVLQIEDLSAVVLVASPCYPASSKLETHPLVLLSAVNFRREMLSFKKRKDEQRRLHTLQIAAGIRIGYSIEFKYGDSSYKGTIDTIIYSDDVETTGLEIRCFMLGPGASMRDYEDFGYGVHSDAEFDVSYVRDIEIIDAI